MITRNNYPEVLRRLQKMTDAIKRLEAVASKKPSDVSETSYILEFQRESEVGDKIELMHPLPTHSDLSAPKEKTTTPTISIHQNGKRPGWKRRAPS